MRYKSLIEEKLIAVSNGLKQLRGQMERGERSEFRVKEEQLRNLFKIFIYKSLF